MVRGALTVRPAADLGASLRLIGRAVPFDVDGTGAGHVNDMAGGCALFDLCDESGRVVGAFALRCDDYSDGRVLTCTAAGAGTERGAVAAMVEFAENDAARIGARTLTCTTQRRGLVRLLQKHGFRVAGYVLRKDR